MSAKAWLEGLPNPRNAEPPQEPRPQRGRKNTKRWCKGKVGREHVVETVRHHYYSQPLFAKRGCHWQVYWTYANGERVKIRDARWSCYHAQQCKVCGKYLNTGLAKEDCPEWQAQQ